eukprot:1932348-Pyramimonas_sp.AAC.1
MNPCMGPMRQYLGGWVYSNIVHEDWGHSGSRPPLFFLINNSLSHPGTSRRACPVFRMRLPYHAWSTLETWQ